MAVDHGRLVAGGAARAMLAIAVVITVFCAAAITGVNTIGGRLPREGQLSFVSYDGTGADIFLADSARGLVQNLTRHPAYDASPLWSPDGERLAFISDRGGALGVYLMEPRARSVRQMTDGSRRFGRILWSPGGERLLLFTASAGLNPDVYALDIASGALTQLTSDTANAGAIMLDLGFDSTQPIGVPSPDGRWELFVAYRDRDWRLFVRDRSEGGDRALARIGDFTQQWSWSPDSRQVAFIALRDGMYDLFLVGVDAAGGAHNERRLTLGRAMDTTPAWRP